jgi:quinol monooxygenase YgiN
MPVVGHPQHEVAIMTRVHRWALVLATLGFAFAAPLQAGDSHEIVVVTHIDIIPNDGLPKAQQLLEQFVVDSRKDPGVKSFSMISWTPTTNHFQLLEVYRNSASFNAHVSAAHTVDFRNQLQQFIGAPYDERVYEPTDR